MKALVLLSLLLLSLPASANKLGLGAMFGNPTGINGKYWLSEDKAVDGGMGFSFGKNTEFTLYSDYLFHNPGAFFFNDEHPLDLYYGIGGRFEFADDIELGVRIPVGLVHMLPDGKADIFGEVAPVVDFISKTGIEIHLLFGARYYF